MSVEEQRLKCSACGAYLFEEDDVVHCPECGAPHHRDCYNSLGHCALESKHGTPEQYDFSKNSRAAEREPEPEPVNRGGNTSQKCGMCGEIYDSEEYACPNCQTPNPLKFTRFTQGLDFLGGVPADLDLGDGVTADEAKRFVFSNTNHYIPKFAAFKLGKKASFNFLAFFFPCAWFSCRKMHKAGLLTGAIEIALTMLMSPFMLALNSVVPEDVATYAQLEEAILQSVGKIGTPAIITAVAAIVLMLIMRIICGVFADYFYRNHCISTIKRIKTESEDADEDFRRKGGVNIFLFIVGLLAVQYLPGIFYMFIS